MISDYRQSCASPLPNIQCLGIVTVPLGLFVVSLVSLTPHATGAEAALGEILSRAAVPSHRFVALNGSVARGRGSSAPALSICFISPISAQSPIHPHISSRTHPCQLLRHP
jgi:hypothetical protein